MKTIFKIFAFAALGIGLVSCNTAALDEVNDRIDELESRVTTLEQLNGQISELRDLITALQNNVSVVSVTQTADGYEILLSDSSKITIKNGQNGQNGQDGKNGKDGQDGTTPVIGVKEDNGVYYWTVNGEFVVDAQGNKFPVSAPAAPMFKIEEGKWYISYDEGKIWEYVADATPAAGDSIFSGVVVGDDVVTFTLVGGATFQIPLASEFGIVMEQAVEVADGATVNVAYVITGATAPVVYCLAEGGYTAEIEASTATEGNVVITAPAVASEGRVIVFAESEGQSIFKSIVVTPEPKKCITFSTAPDNGAAISVDHSKSLYAEALVLAWSADVVGATYTVSLSLAEDMSNGIVAATGSSTSLTLDTRTLNNLMSKLGKAYTKDVVVYYQVVAGGDAVDPSAVKNVTISTEFGSLDDPRDGEFYTVTKVGGVEWLAENLRATKYSDGSAMPTGEKDLACFFYESGKYGKKAGAYYGYGNAMGCHYNTASTRFNNLVGAEEKVQGVCPAGWHVPNQNDWMGLMNTAFTLAGASISSNFFTNANGAYGRAAFQKMVLRADVEEGFAETVAETTRAGYTNDLGLYFLPVGRYDSANAANGGAVEPTGYGVSFASWNSTMTSIWKAWSPFIKFGDGQYYTINQNIHWTCGAAETLRCVKD